MALHRAATRFILAVILSTVSVASAHAAPISGGGGGTIDPALADCISRTKTTITATPNPVALGAAATLNWSVVVPTDCQTLLQNPFLNSSPVALSGSLSVRHFRGVTGRLNLGYSGGTEPFVTTIVAVIVSPNRVPLCCMRKLNV